MERDLKSYEIWMLIDGTKLYPFSSHGFEFAQGSFKTLVERSSNNLFLNPDGEVLEIAEMSPKDNDIGAKLKRLLGRRYGIRVELRPRKIDLSELKVFLTQGLAQYHAVAEADENWAFATLPISVSKTAIMDATSTKQLYAVLDLPSPLDCLDLL